MIKSLQPCYVEKIQERGDLKIWLVDGTYVRGRIDEEFTNFGQHYRYPFIPLDELWIDSGVKREEARFFIDHLLVEHRLMSEGIPYEKAIDEADRAERKERRRAGDVKKATTRGKAIPDAGRMHVRLWKALENGIRVWIVDGRLVRSVYDIDFTAGGHDYVYEFVPFNEVWIDDSTLEKERSYILLHELHERNRMAEGWQYSKAHNESSKKEYYYRHHPDELHEALVDEGWS
jgi:hypothetical protein